MWWDRLIVALLLVVAVACLLRRAVAAFRQVARGRSCPSATCGAAPPASRRNRAAPRELLQLGLPRAQPGERPQPRPDDTTPATKTT